MQQQAFCQLLKDGKFRDMYNMTTKDFQSFISYEQFVEVAGSFYERGDQYELYIQNQLLDIKQYVWVDRKKEKACAAGFNEEGKVQTLYLKPFLQFHNRCWTKNEYRMPICDEWFVFWGGTKEFVNYHYAYEQQRFAYDLVVVKDGATSNFASPRNESFYAFGKHVVAPLDGTVVKVVDKLYDNAPGEMDETNPAGNYVVIAHDNGEYSMLAHFKQSSIAVREGDYVKQGQFLGECGNSGNSSEPHIHFQVMDDANFKKGRSLRISFEDGREPVQGDAVKPMPPKKSMLVEKGNKLDDAWTFYEVLMFVPRAIMNFFKNL